VKVTVWAFSWEFQCCGSPFAVGDRVEWVLMGTQGDTEFDVGARAAMGGRVLAPVELETWETFAYESHGVAVARTGGLSVQLIDPPPPVVTDRGNVICEAVWESHHVFSPPEPVTIATVTAISAVSWALEPGLDREGRKTMKPVVGSARLSEVAETDLWVRNPDGDDFVGWLVELDIDDKAAAPGH
jgi:hypothetical protein